MTCEPDAVAETRLLPLMSLGIRLANAEVDIPCVPSDQCTGIPVPPTVTVKTPDSGPPGIWLIEMVAEPGVPDFSVPEIVIDPLLLVAAVNSAEVASSVSESTRPRLSYARVNSRDGVCVEELYPYWAFTSPIGPYDAGLVAFAWKRVEG